MPKPWLYCLAPNRRILYLNLAHQIEKNLNRFGRLGTYHTRISPAAPNISKTTAMAEHFTKQVRAIPRHTPRAYTARA